MRILDRPAVATSRPPAGPGGRRSAVTGVGPAMQALPWLTGLPVAAMGAVLVAAFVAPGALAQWAMPLAVLGALLGLPHGAVDHLVPRWAWAGAPHRRWTRGHLVLFGAGYVATAGLALTALLVAPAPTLVGFLLVSAGHFGCAEVQTSAQRAARDSATPTDWPVALAHGGAVVGLLVWARPADITPVLAPLSPWLVDALADVRVLGLCGVGLVVAVGMGVLAHRRRVLDAGELVLVAAVFAAAPPLAAFGVYFGAWHAVRHTGRLLDLAAGRPSNPAGGILGWRAAGGILVRASLWPTAAAAGALAVLWCVRDVASLQAEVSILLALTFPHAAVVWALDRRRPQ